MNNVYANAIIIGDNNIRGRALFYKCYNGVMVEIEVTGLPNINMFNVFPIHIHDGIDCSNIYGHYNPTNKVHPYHSGDLPDLYSNNGYAYYKFYTEKFNIEELNNKFIIIHEPNTESSTEFGKKIACGNIKINYY